MSIPGTHKYFERAYFEWSIIGFLNTCIEEPFQAKISLYLTSLKILMEHEEGRKKDKAQQFSDKYNKASITFVAKGEITNKVGSQESQSFL